MRSSNKGVALIYFGILLCNLTHKNSTARSDYGKLFLRKVARLKEMLREEGDGKGKFEGVWVFILLHSCDW